MQIKLNVIGVNLVLGTVMQLFLGLSSTDSAGCGPLAALLVGSRPEPPAFTKALGLNFVRVIPRLGDGALTTIPVIKFSQTTDDEIWTTISGQIATALDVNPEDPENLIIIPEGPADVSRADTIRLNAGRPANGEELKNAMNTFRKQRGKDGKNWLQPEPGYRHLEIKVVQYVDPSDPDKVNRWVLGVWERANQGVRLLSEGEVDKIKGLYDILEDFAKDIGVRVDPMLVQMKVNPKGELETYGAIVGMNGWMLPTAAEQRVYGLGVPEAAVLSHINQVELKMSLRRRNESVAARIVEFEYDASTQQVAQEVLDEIKKEFSGSIEYVGELPMRSLLHVGKDPKDATMVLRFVLVEDGGSRGENVEKVNSVVTQIHDYQNRLFTSLAE